MNIILKRVFYESKWGIAYRDISEFNSNDKNRQCYKVINSNNRYWGADPFLIKFQGTIYLFCELMDLHKSRGMIGWCNLSLNVKPKLQMLMDLGCHTSYPCVFSYKDDIYMIPETVARKTVEIYTAVNFPHEWKKLGNILENINAVDSTVYFADEIPYLFIYERNEEVNERYLWICEIDMKSYKIKNRVKLLTYYSKNGRPAGNLFFDEGGNLIRPIQYGENFYGEKIVFNKIDDIFTDCREYPIGELDVKSIKINRNYKIFGIHTINRLGNLEVIDFKYNQFDLFRPFRILLKLFKIGDYRFEK